ncbi:MAG: CoA ester lyase [Rhodospirillales bacterium]|nr:CoA ester lyase [Rhodospirillales bacterium]
MSFTTVTPGRTRANRSQLSVPASSRRFVEKSTQSAADIIMFDLEDSVPVADKAGARAALIAALHDLDWGDRTLSVRINGLDTPYMYRDVIDVVEQAGDRLDLVMVPKIGTAADVYAVDTLLTQIEAAKGRERPLGLEVLIESALGLENVEAIAGASRRLEALHFGPGDFAASIGARTMTIGGPHPGYAVLTDADENGARASHWNDMWHYALARLVVAARAHGLRPIDGPYADYRDEAGFRAAAMRSAVLGMEGKWVIHPSQIALANEIFRPSDEEMDKARRILAAMEQAGAEGRGAVTLDGRMIDIASIRQAEALVRKAEAIAARADGAHG